MKVEDFVTVCERCEGSGVDVICTKNYAGVSKEVKTCPECKGEKVLFTEDGKTLKKIFEFLTTKRIEVLTGRW